MDEEDFQSGNLSIRYLEEHPDLIGGAEDEEVLKAAAVAAALLQEQERNRVRIQTTRGDGAGGFSAWKRAGRPFSGTR